MRREYTQVFYDVFNEAFKNYTKGNWERARKQFRQVESLKRAPDGPSKVLIEYMERYNF